MTRVLALAVIAAVIATSGCSSGGSGITHEAGVAKDATGTTDRADTGVVATDGATIGVDVASAGDGAAAPGFEVGADTRPANGDAGILVVGPGITPWACSGTSVTLASDLVTVVNAATAGTTVCIEKGLWHLDALP